VITQRIRNVPRRVLVLTGAAVVVGVLSLALVTSSSGSGDKVGGASPQAATPTRTPRPSLSTAAQTTTPSPGPEATASAVTTPEPPGASSPVGPAAPSAGQWWRPALGTDWQWQLSGAVDTSVSAEVFDIDGESASAATVAALHANGAGVICYIDAGGWESYRSDAGSFPSSVLGNGVDGWPDERWLDIRELTVLLPIMEARIADCRQKGFDAVEPDLLDGYTNDTGFALTAADQLAYNRAVADLAHRYGLGVALKNDPEQAEALEPAFDFAVVEECFQYDECEAYSPFVRAGKAVLHVEYEGSLDAFCPVTSALGFSSMKKHLALDAWRQVCP
jgi:hypothetical protein